MLAQAAPAPKPKLVVAIVVDQFRYDYLLRFRSEYKAGLARLLNEGAVYTNAHYRHAATVTAVGHSTVMSGATPSVSGIIANEWYDRESSQTVTSVSDADTRLVGGPYGATGSSPRRMLVSTVGDELKIADPNSKVIGISLKDRSAILPAGHRADGAYWYDPDTNGWVTSSYYRDELPAWVKAVNDSHPSRKLLGAEWRPLDGPESAKPFCTMVAGSDIRFCGGLEATPWGNELIEDLAERAIEAENLGGRGSVDLLAISFSSNDYVGHAVGPDDPAVRDISIRTDRLLGKLLDLIDRKVGAGNSLVVLTADHGVAPVPEVNIARKMPGGRLADGAAPQAVTEALTKRFGAGKWLLPASSSMLYFNLETLKAKAADRAEVERVAAETVRALPHIARVYTRTELMTGQASQDEVARAVSVGFFERRSGDLYIVPDPYYLSEGTGTSHGTPYAYDTHVPLIFWGAGIEHVRPARRVAVNDIAPTLCEILGITEPSGAKGDVLTDALATQ